MDALIVERDELAGSMLIDALDKEALNLLPDAAPRVAITSISRGHKEGLVSIRVVAAMRRK
jgi:hypothetical protein